ncbi:hypothetical protein JOC37_001203 [Desulfohalotomaculum tongense]|uniref:hypothetical protein n=1 Tax=Desulforadius tongensis TaxID=1216062 RepID=UPI001959D2C0|nr:hypothetical protein [Desulforadius tongensis]MBM7854825.1 hypothetical protein [Desulforadius tongensis]
MSTTIDVEKFVKDHQQEIEHLVNIALNRAGDIVNKRVSTGEVKPNLQEVLPLMLYEILITHTTSTLRLAAEMMEESLRNNNKDN